MSEYRKSDIEMVKTSLRTMKEICNNHQETCKGCPLRAHDHKTKNYWCIAINLPCEWTDQEIDECFT